MSQQEGGAKADPRQAATFLRDLRGGGPWSVTSIQDGMIHTETFSGDRGYNAMRDWITARIDRLNLYWWVNPAYGSPGTKAALEDVACLERLHVDLDPDKKSTMPEEQQRALILALIQDEARLKKIGLPGLPSFLIDSGGGYWAFWNLATPLSLDGPNEQDRRDNAFRAGGYNKWVGDRINEELGLKVADNCHNVDRIARLPFTHNFPTEKKRKLGRRQSITQAFNQDAYRTYRLEDFGCVDLGEAGPCREAVEAVVVNTGDWEPLPRGDAWAAVQKLIERYPLVRPKTTELILLGRYLHDEGDDNLDTKSENGQYVTDRNRVFHRANRALQQAGVPLGLIIEVLKDPRFAVSEHARFPANKGVVRKSESKGRELHRFVEAQVKKVAAKLRKEALTAQNNARLLDEAATVTTPESAPAASGGDGNTPPPPPPPGGDEPPPDGDPIPPEMRFDHALTRDGNVGAPLKTERNILVALRRLGVRLSYNEFADRLLIDNLEGHGPELTDAAMVSLRLTVDRLFGFLPNKDYFYDVVVNAARANTFHPVLSYFDSLAWDTRPRIDTWLIDYGGAKDTPYVRAVSRLMLVAAVRRQKQPGCKFDEMPVLEGPQGTNKSSALKLLAVDEDWFLDDLPLGASSKEMIEQMTGKWIVEIADLHKRGRPDVNRVKAQLSRTEDRARLAYGKIATSVKRQCVLFATTNEDKYLEDPTGERRFWPILTGRFNLEALAQDRDQLWAEAVAAEATDESIRMDQTLWGEAAKEQAERSIIDPWVQHLEEMLGDMNGKILNSDVWRLVGLTPDKMKRNDTLRIANVMRQLGFERASLRFCIGNETGRKAKGFVRGERERDREVQIMVFESPSGRVSVRNNIGPEEAVQMAQADFLNGHDHVPF